MIAYITRRLLSGVLLLMALTLVTYVVFYTIPLEPACQILGCGPHTTTTPAQLKAADHKIGADQPVVVQYGRFLWRLVRHGSLGTTFAGEVPVRSLVVKALPVTVSIVLGGGLLLLVLAVPLAVLGAMRPNSGLDRGILIVSLLGVVFHPFVVGLGLRQVFAQQLHLAPFGGYCALTPSGAPCAGPLGWASHLALPWITFALFFLPLYVRMLRARVLESLDEPHVLVARAKGASQFRVIRSHVLRTAMTPVVSMLAIDLGTAVTAAIYIETVYGMPGIGALALGALNGARGGYDLPTVVGIVVTVAAAIVVLNLAADIVTAALDPRIRLRRTTGFIPLPAPVARVTGPVGRAVPEPARAAIALAAVLVVVVVIVVEHPGGGKKAVPKLPQEPRQALRLGWNEDVAFSGQKDMHVRFQVRSVDIGRRTWVVHAKVTNRSKGALTLLPPDNTVTYGTGPALLVPTGVDRTTGYSSLKPVTATIVDPPLPKQLAPGQDWTGTFAGTGRIPRQTLIFVGFGQFEDPTQVPAFPSSWNSRESFRLS